MRRRNFPGREEPPAPVVSGHLFYRFIQIWLGNTNCTDATWQSVFQTFSAQGITHSGYYTLTGGPHPLTIAVPYYDEDKQGPPAGGMEYTLKIEFVQDIETSYINRYIEGKTGYRNHGILPAISVLNIIIGTGPGKS